jgi:NAD(P)-dependent dehydrogenase (short-subunit alcohol dehydrogenase family)
VGFALLNPPDANEKIPHAPFGRKGCGCHWRGRGPEGRARRHLRQGAGGRGRQGPPIAIEEIDTALWDEFMTVNVRGTFLCVKAAIPAMRRNNYGKIINLSSTTMLSGLSHRLHYVTTKGAIAAMTRSMARELGAYGIRVNSLAPGLVMNDSVAAAMAGRPGLHDFVLNTRAIKKDVFADELVGTLIYLASPDSDAVTGQFLIVDNGGDYT